MEALAAVRALSFVSEIGFSSTILEGDSEVIINSLKIIYVSLTTYGNLIFEAKLTVGCTDNFFLVWMKDVPPYLNVVLLAKISFNKFNGLLLPKKKIKK